MGNLIRRDKTIKVEAQRVEPVPPSPGSPPPTSQTFIHITTPAGAVPPPTPPPQSQPPQEIHYHTTIHHAPRRRNFSKNLSFLGTVGLVLGALAAAAQYTGQATSFIHPLAVIGVVASGLAFLGAVLFRRTGQTIPFLGLLISGGVYLFWMHANGQLQPQIDKLKSSLPSIEIPLQTNSPHSPSTAPTQSSPPLQR